MSSPPAGEEIVSRLARFGRRLRKSGLEVGTGRIQDALTALTVVDIGSREQTYWALCCTLVSRYADLDAFDEAFSRFYERDESEQPDLTPGASRDQQAEPEPDAVPQAGERSLNSEERGGRDHDEDPEDVEAGMRWSAIERLRELDFARYTDEELLEASRLLDRVARAAPLRRSRRLKGAHEGQVFDKRRTLRSAMRTDGYPIARSWRQPRLIPRKLVFVVDVSGSMQPYARAMVMFLQAAVRSRRRVEAFTFGTRLTRITQELQGRDPDRALMAAARVVRDWAGGTRIGSNLEALNASWGRRGLTRGAVVVIVSDGWERGDIETMVQEMERLQRAAHTVVWVNPLAGEPGYEPLARGMAAALPHIDHFLPGHNLNSLDTLAAVLEGLPLQRSQLRGAHLLR